MEYAGVAITAPFPGTLLTGLVAALGPACRLRRRYAHAPAGAIFRWGDAPLAHALAGACGPSALNTMSHEDLGGRRGSVADFVSSHLEAESKSSRGFCRDGLQAAREARGARRGDP